MARVRVVVDVIPGVIDPLSYPFKGSYRVRHSLIPDTEPASSFSEGSSLQVAHLARPETELNFCGGDLAECRCGDPQHTAGAPGK